MVNYVLKVTLTKDAVVVKEEEIYSYTVDETNFDFENVFKYIFNGVTKAIDALEGTKLWGFISKFISLITPK